MGTMLMGHIPTNALLDTNGAPILGLDGKLLVRGPEGQITGVLPPNAVLDAHGKPVLGADGRPLIRDANGELIGLLPHNTLLNENGQPVLGADGRPLVRGADGEAIGMLPPNALLDANGKPVLGADGRPLTRGANGELIGMLPAGVLLDGKGQPVLGADGRPLIRDANGNLVSMLPPGVPQAHKAHASYLHALSALINPCTVCGAGVLLGADGQPTLGADGRPLIRGLDGHIIGERPAGDSSLKEGARPGRIKKSKSRSSVLADESGSSRREPGQELTSHGKTKKSHSSQIVPAGRLLTITRLKVKDVPDVDMRGGKKNLSDPYLVLTAISNGGKSVDETRTSHVENVYRAAWTETFRLFFPDDDDLERSQTKIQISLMDKNKKKADVLIGDATVLLKNGSGRMRVEIASRCVSAARPFVSFHYEAPPEMYFEVADWIKETDLVEDDAAVSEYDSDDEGETQGRRYSDR